MVTNLSAGSDRNVPNLHQHFYLHFILYEFTEKRTQNFGVLFSVMAELSDVKICKQRIGIDIIRRLRSWRSLFNRLGSWSCVLEIRRKSV